MSGVARVSTRISPPTGRRPRAGTVSNDELRNRRHAGDFSHFAPTLLENECRLPPDYNKDLPSIPSASAAVCMEMVDSPTPSPTITAQYLQRRRSPLDSPQSDAVSGRVALDASADSLESLHASSSIMIQFGVSTTTTQAMDAPIGAPLVPPQSRPIRRALPETESISPSHEHTSLFIKVREDGSVVCTREDCLEVLPSSMAFLSHLHIHLIHEGLNSCELCGTQFTDDSHKNRHPDSCPKLPAFHKIGSLKSEPFGLLQILSRLRFR